MMTMLHDDDEDARVGNNNLPQTRNGNDELILVNIYFNGISLSLSRLF